MKILIKIPVIFVCTFFISSTSFAQVRLFHMEWDKGEIINNIELSTIKDFKHEKQFKPFRAKFVVNQSILKVISLLNDTGDTKFNPPGYESTKVLEKSVMRTVIHRMGSRNIPFKPRDFVVEFINHLDYGSRKLVLMMSSTENPMVPILSGHHRGVLIDGFIVARVIAKDKTEIEIGTLIDLGGWMPRFIAKKLLKNDILNTAEALKNELETKERVISPKLKLLGEKLLR